MKKNFVALNKQLGAKSKRQPESNSPQKPLNIPDKIKNIERKLEKIQDNTLQSRILEEMKLIKEELREIKSNIHYNKSPKKSQSFEEDIEDSVVKTIKSRSKSKESYEDFQKNESAGSGKPELVSQVRPEKTKRVVTVEREIIAPGQLQSCLKDYRINENSRPSPYYSGYVKKNSSPVFIKYSTRSLERELDVYRKLWKEIVKARWVCVNRIHENREADISFLILDKNIASMDELPPDRVLADSIKILEFLHNCGYLYRNMSPQHFMLNVQNKLVILDFKNVKRYVDAKGNHVQFSDSSYTCGDFGSTSQLKLAPEGRKDDLESLGYMALYMLTGDLPWMGMGRQEMMKCRNGLTLQQLYKKIPQWLQFMKSVHKLNRIQKPDYNFLIELVDPKE